MIYLLIIVLGVAADQLIKWLIVEALPVGSGFSVIPGLLDVHHVRNTGAAWSMFSNSTLGLAIFSLVMLVGLSVWFWKTPTDKVWMRMALAVVISGAVGNMIDRFRLGYVVDFLQLPHWPVFNLADILLCCGVAALAVLVLLDEKADKKEAVAALKDNNEDSNEDSGQKNI